MNTTDNASPPLLPVIPEYKSWVKNVQEGVAADNARADAAFAGQRGPLSAADVPARPATPESDRGVLADEKA
ncbi:hypothetical protein [Solidesulfovibrio sp.]|uniref:hypothetical protein n=1 Tax=Solidesulfovibrio sp. TaxID=2910990 RepID=UPI00263780CC|nr:hypothetical protein [Solidesulfovibrio sp.]